jgi:ATP-dependent protease ClpP protease subunit
MKQGHVYLYGEIMPFHGTDAENYGVVSLSTVKNQIEKLDEDVEEIVLHINSVGGALYEAYAIFDFLSSVGKPFISKAEGTVASAATVIFMIAKVREITKNTIFLIHPPSNGAYGTADEIEKSADDLRNDENKLAEFYAKYTGGDKAALLDIMKQDKALDVDVALELKFATVVVDPVQAKKLYQIKQFENIENMKKNIITAATVVANAFKELKRLGIDVKASPSAMSVKTDDGTELNIESESDKIVIGDKVTAADGTEVADGNYTLEDGMMIVVTSGAVSEVTEASIEDEATKNKRENDEMKATIAALETKVASLESATTERDELAATLADVTNHLKTLKVAYKPSGKSSSFNKQTPEDDAAKTAEEVKAKFDKFKNKNKK